MTGYTIEVVYWVFSQDMTVEYRLCLLNLLTGYDRVQYRRCLPGVLTGYDSTVSTVQYGSGCLWDALVSALGWSQRREVCQMDTSINVLCIAPSIRAKCCATFIQRLIYQPNTVCLMSCPRNANEELWSTTCQYLIYLLGSEMGLLTGLPRQFGASTTQTIINTP